LKKEEHLTNLVSSTKKSTKLWADLRRIYHQYLFNGILYETMTPAVKSAQLNLGDLVVF